MRLVRRKAAATIASSVALPGNLADQSVSHLGSNILRGAETIQAAMVRLIFSSCECRFVSGSFSCTQTFSVFEFPAPPPDERDIAW